MAFHIDRRQKYKFCNLEVIAGIALILGTFLFGAMVNSGAKLHQNRRGETGSTGPLDWCGPIDRCLKMQQIDVRYLLLQIAQIHLNLKNIRVTYIQDIVYFCQIK